MEAVPATSRRRVVNGQVQVVAPEEPLEGAAGLLAPAFVSGTPVGFEAGGGHGLRLDRLLIEPGPFTAALIKAIGADGDKMTPSRVSPLQVGQPMERLQSGLGHGLIRDPLAAHKQGLWQHGVAIGQPGLIPAPFIRTAVFI